MDFVLGIALSAEQLVFLSTSLRAIAWLQADSPSPFHLVEKEGVTYLDLPLSHPKKWSCLEVEVSHFCSVVHQIFGFSPLPEQLLFFRPCTKNR